MKKRMGEMKQIFAVLGLCAVMAAVPAEAVNAQDDRVSGTETAVQETAEYDMEKGGTQSFEIVDENGEKTEIVIEEVPGKERVANKTYKITGKYRDNWTAGFYIDVKDNKIVKAYDKFYKAKKGSISNGRLTKESNTKVVLRFDYNKKGNAILSRVEAQILDKELLVKSS